MTRHATGRSSATTAVSRALVGLAVAAGSFAPLAASGVIPLRIDVRARALEPGEPMRIVAVSGESLRNLEGEFLGRSVFLVRDGEIEGGAETWTGWSMIALDATAGPAAIELRGTSAEGRPVGGTRAVTVLRRDFPEETLSVAPKYVEPPPDVQARLDRERTKLRALYATRRPLVPRRRAFERPVPGEPTSVFGTRRLYNGKPRSPHPGLDLRAATGTPVRGSGDGVVSLAEDLYYSGGTVIVDHGGGLFTLYAHLSALRVREGDTISAGDVVGLSGATGRVTGPHLHWGAKIGDAPFDPQALLDERLFTDLN